MSLKMKLGRFAGPLNCCEWCEFSSRSWHLFEQHLNRCQHSRRSAVAKADAAETKGSLLQKRKRNYRCNSCDFHAQRPKPLLQHVKEAHQPDLEIYSCELCNYASRFKQKVTQHKRVAHDKVLPVPVDGADSHSVDGMLVLKQEVSTIQTHDEVVVSAAAPAKKRNQSCLTNDGDTPDCFTRKKLVKCPKISKEAPQEFQTGDCQSTSSGISSTETRCLLSLNDEEYCQEQSTESQSNGTDKRKVARTQAAVGPDDLNLITKEVGPKTGENVGQYPKVVRFKCQLCSYLNSHKLAVVKHLRSIHGKKIGHFCTKCEFITNSKVELSRHILTHSRRKHKCPDCLFITVKKHDFLDHRACHVISGPYSCSMCSFCSTTDSVILAHKADHHLPEEFLDQKKNDHGKLAIAKVKSLQYACDLCSLAFQNQSDVLEHVSAVHPSTSLKCPICTLVFKDRRCLNIHSTLAHGLSAADRLKSSGKSRNTEASVLPDAASEENSSLLKKLEAAEMSEKKSNCIKEGLKVKIRKPVKTKKKLKLSKSIRVRHSTVSDDKSSVKLSASQNFITSNYDEKSPKELEVMPVLEEQCDSDLLLLGDVQTQSGIILADDGNAFFCVKCDMTLSSRTSLECHLSRYHIGSVLYNCPFCSYKCLWKLSIKNHLKIHRNISKSVDNMNLLVDQSFCLSGVTAAVPGQKPAGSLDDSLHSDSMSEANLQPPTLTPYKTNLSDCGHISKKNRNSNSRLSSVTGGAEFEIKEEVNEDAMTKLQVDEKKADRFYCTTCNMNCDSASRLARHKERHADLKRFMCSLCGVRSNWDFYIRNHLQKSHASRGGKMKVLSEGEARRTIEEYNRKPKGSHVAKSSPDLKTMRKEKDGSRQNFKKAEPNKIVDIPVGCNPVVESSPTVPVPVTSVRRKYHNWFCDQCPFATDSPSKLASHKEAHEDLKRYLCPVCGKRSNWVLYIQAHIRKAHRSSKAKAIELTRDEARQTLSDYLSQGRNYFRPGSRKNRLKLKKPKQKFNSKTAVNSERNSMKNVVPNKMMLEEKTDYLLDLVDFSENFEDNCSNKDSLLQVGSLDDSFASVNDGRSSESKTRGLSSRSSAGQIKGNAFCKYKRHKCSVCGMRTNWQAALSRHRLSMHPHAKTIKLSVEEAKATLDLYENQLKHEIFMSNIHAKSDGDVKNKVSSETKTQPVTAKRFLKKQKPPSSAVMFGCSQCDYKSKWKNNVYKHTKHVHPGARITGIGSKAKSVKSKDYSCSECGLKSESIVALRKHVQNVHTLARMSNLESSQCKAATFSRFSDSAFDSLALDSNEEPLDESASTGEQYSKEKCSAQSAHHSDKQNSTIDSSVLNAGSIASYQRNCMASELPHSVNTTLMSKFGRPRNFACSGCPYRGDRRLYVLKHIRSVHAKSNCQVIHIRNRNRSKLIPDYQRRLPQSLRISREAMHQCDICPYRATRLNRLEKHKGLHTAKPGCSYECTLCPYYCPSSYCLEKHMLWHKTKTNVTISDSRLLSDHAYSQILPGVNKRAKFTCEKCPYVSGNYQHFLYHKQFHRPSPSAAYKCDVCPFWVAEKRMIVQHAKLHQCTTSQPLMQSEETGMLDDVVETARVKWDIIAAKCVPAVENKMAPLAPSGDGRVSEMEGRTARNKSSSPRSLMASKSFTEMWLSGSLVGSGSASRLEENSMDSLESSRLASKYSSADDLARNGRSKENDSDMNKFDRRSISNASGDFDLPAARSWHCEKCPYLTTFLIKFKRHMSLHGSQQKYECQFCDYSVPRYYLLLQHRKLHFAPNRNLLFSQPITSLQRVAQLEGGSEELLKEITHVAAMGSVSEPAFYEDTFEFRLPSKLFRCDDCPYSTTQHKSFAAHQRHHTVASAYNCPYCSYSVGKERLLNSHVIEHFNLPGCEMSAYSSSEAPELLESMKATILLLSGMTSTLEVTKEAVNCSEMKEEVEPVAEKPEECSDFKEILCSVDNETQMKLTSVADDDVKVAESQLKLEETSQPGQSIDNDDDDLILILETNPGSQEDLTGPGDGGSGHEEGMNDTQLVLEVESVEDAASEKESDDFEARPAQDTPVVNRHNHIDSSVIKASDYHYESQNGFENLNADSALEEDEETGRKSETNFPVRVIDPTALDCVIVASQEESKGLDDASPTDQMHLEDEEHHSKADESSDIEDTFILLISDSEPETTPGDGNEVEKEREEEKFGS